MKDDHDTFDWDRYYEECEKGVGNIRDPDDIHFEGDEIDLDSRSDDFLNDDHWSDMPLWGGDLYKVNEDDAMLPDFAGKSWANKSLLTVFDGITDFNRTTFRDQVKSDAMHHSKAAERVGLMAYDSLAMDVFNSLFKSSTTLKPQELFREIEEPIIKKQLSIHRSLIKSLKESSNFERLKDPCSLNLIFSKEVSIDLSKGLIDIYRMLPEVIDCASMGGEEQVQQSLFDSNDGGDSWGSGTSQIMIGVQIENIIKGLEVKIQDLTKAMAQWGISNDYLKSLPIESQMTIHTMLKNDFHKELMELSSKFMNNSGGRISIRKTTKLIKSTIKFGNDLQSVVPSDRLLAYQNKAEFIRRYAEGSLAMLIGHKTIGKGPIVCAIDDSGSMDPPSGTRAKWSRALFLSLANAAVKNDRSLFSCLFDSRLGQTVALTPADKKEKRMAKAFSFIDCRLGGGTSFMEPLMWAFERLKTDAQRGDIIFMTDGECRLTPQALNKLIAMKEEERCKFIVVLIGHRRINEDHSLSPLADKTYNLNINYHSDVNTLEEIMTMKDIMKEATE